MEKPSEKIESIIEFIENEIKNLEYEYACILDTKIKENRFYLTTNEIDYEEEQKNPKWYEMLNKEQNKLNRIIRRIQKCNVDLMALRGKCYPEHKRN